MGVDRVAEAQHWTLLAVARRGAGDPPKQAATQGRTKRGTPEAAAALSVPVLSPGTLSHAERRRLLAVIEKVIEGAYAHLPLKKARYGTDPVQRLRILGSRVEQLSDDAFRLELTDILTRLRDGHTRYATGALREKLAVLPFLVEMIGTLSAPTYLVTKVGDGLTPAFRPGVVLEYWNGVPIDRAVQLHSESEVGGRPDSQRALATQSLTIRSLEYSPLPDEDWVVVSYRSTTGRAREIKLPWRVIDLSAVDTFQDKTAGESLRMHPTRAVNPAAAATQQVKVLMFAPGALTGEQAKPPKRTAVKTRGLSNAKVISTNLTSTFKAMSLSAPDGDYGHLRIFNFDGPNPKDPNPAPFLMELHRLVRLLPDRGLILDIRNNPGGNIVAAEQALQFFTPKHIEPTRFSLLATPFTRAMAELRSLRELLAPWKPSLDAAVLNGELYSQPIPITDVKKCNNIGQKYGGPVVLVSDSTTYSAGDLFSAGFVDNGIGPFVCIGQATGAGGANMWEYDLLRSKLGSSNLALPDLPGRSVLEFSFRRATRSGPNEGVPIEDIGIAGTPYALTRDDLLAGNCDLIEHCINLLRQQPLTKMKNSLDPQARTVTVTTEGLSRVDALFDEHPGTSTRVTGTATTTITYPSGTRAVHLIGWRRGQVLQRRRFSIPNRQVNPTG